MDYGWDGKALIDDGSVAIYSVVEEMPLAVQTRPEFQADDIVPIAYKVTDAGSYTISLDHFDGAFLGGQNIYLKDNVTGEIVDLKDIDYMFTTEAGQFTNRFEIVYTTEVLNVNNQVLTSDMIVVYQKNGSITVDGGSTDVKHIDIYDIRGRHIYAKPNINTPAFTITDFDVQQQVVMLHIATDKGLITKKIIM